MFKMDKIILVIAISLLMQGCASALFSAHQNRVELDLGERRLSLQASLTDSDTVHTDRVSVTRRLYRTKQGNFIAYEKAVAFAGYEFESVAATLLYHLFHPAHSEKLFSMGNIRTYRLVTKDGKALNLIIQVARYRYVTLIYGMNNPQMKRFVSKLGGHISSPLSEPLSLNPKRAYMSDWSMKNLMLHPIVKRSGRFGGRIGR